MVPNDACPEPLTKRELEVLALVVQGLENKEIAAFFDRKESTVVAHLNNIYRKLDVSNRTKAATFAIQHGLIELPILQGIENRHDP